MSKLSERVTILLEPEDFKKFDAIATKRGYRSIGGLARYALNELFNKTEKEKNE